MGVVQWRLNNAGIIELAAEPSSDDLLMVVPTATGVAEMMSYANFKTYVLTSANISGLGTAATSSATDFVAVIGDEMTGPLTFSGTGHVGIVPNNLTTAQRDAIGSPATGAIIYNTTTGQHERYNGSSWDALGGGASLIVDTRANILATVSPSSGDMFYSIDSEEFFVHDGTDFQVAPLEHQAASTTPDIGLQPPMVVNDLAGYSDSYVANKELFNIKIGESAFDEARGLRTSNGVLQFYSNGAWGDVVTGFVFREDSSVGSSGSYYELEHKPVGLTQYYQLMNGNSDELGLNGLPLSQQYSSSLGPYPYPLRVQGRSYS